MRLALRGQRAVALLHILCLLWALFAVSQNLGVPKSVRKEKDFTYGGQWKHLTFLNQVLQSIVYALCVITDVVALCIPSKEKKVSSVVVPLRDFIFSAYVFPIGLFVAVAFWGLYAYDRELVYPKELDKINPTWLNHSMAAGLQITMLIRIIQLAMIGISEVEYLDFADKEFRAQSHLSFNPASDYFWIERTHQQSD